MSDRILSICPLSALGIPSVQLIPLPLLLGREGKLPINQVLLFLREGYRMSSKRQRADNKIVCINIVSVQNLVVTKKSLNLYFPLEI